ncbi:MAG: histidine phosphatase family protein [Micromonosporaceae bacterium]
MTARELILARHGEARCNLAGTMTGPSCTGLTDNGRAQTERLGKRLHAETAYHGPLEAVYASTTRRALQTAHLLTGFLGVEVHEESYLRVPDAGPHAEGKPWPELRRTEPRDPVNPDRPLAPGGEGWVSYLTRAHAALTRILDGHTGRVLIVGHTETLKAAYSLFLGHDDLHRMKFDFDHTALTIWRPASEWPGAAPTHQRWTLVCHNDTTHVPHNAPRHTLQTATACNDR